MEITFDNKMLNIIWNEKALMLNLGTQVISTGELIEVLKRVINYLENLK